MVAMKFMLLRERFKGTPHVEAAEGGPPAAGSSLLGRTCRRSDQRGRGGVGGQQLVELVLEKWRDSSGREFRIGQFQDRRNTGHAGAVGGIIVHRHPVLPDVVLAATGIGDQPSAA